MADYTWPGFPVTRFQMRVEPLTKSFASPYSNQVQGIDLMGDVWKVSMDLAPGVGLTAGLAIEAFLDSLKGVSNRIIMPNLLLSNPRGTMRGAPVITSAVPQLSNTLLITTAAGATLNGGDMLGCGGQLFRVLASAAADGSGHITVTVAPRVRAPGGIAAGSLVTIYQPTAPFILASANPAVDWMPGGQYTAPSIELRESF